MNKPSLAVVGLGYVGLPLALLADKKGYRVFGIDIDEKKIEKLKRRESPFFDPAIEEKLKTSSIEPTADWNAVRRVETIVICVPTPVHRNRTPDLEPVKGACRGIAPHLRKGHLVVLESTVNPGVCDSVVKPILETSGLKAGVDFELSHCPERVNPGDSQWNVENIPRVAGSMTKTGLDRTVAFYASVVSASIYPMETIREAEAVKIVENSFRDVNIAFANELAQSFSKLGINLPNVIRGASTKPFSFMAHFPGCGVGGHCIPVDPYYLIHEAKQNGFTHRFLTLARRINEEMPHYTAELVREALAYKGTSIEGVKVAVLGLAYKANIDDCRESPSFHIIRHLERMGAFVSSFDPFAVDRGTAKTLDEALSGAAVAVIATAHRTFLTLTPEFFEAHGVKTVIDGRNCLPEERFESSRVMYRGIGRGYPTNNKPAELAEPASDKREHLTPIMSQ